MAYVWLILNMIRSWHGGGLPPKEFVQCACLVLGFAIVLMSEQKATALKNPVLKTCLQYFKVNNSVNISLCAHDCALKLRGPINALALEFLFLTMAPYGRSRSCRSDLHKT